MTEPAKPFIPFTETETEAERSQRVHRQDKFADEMSEIFGRELTYEEAMDLI
jgi:hypothetical protein